ncbi:hypothetical protein B0J17DRAFT_245836 [Rhizoctonia solani]|nr:hypothetical protein B0J17DRAFT_245836 [Rhizoctonia solani]
MVSGIRHILYPEEDQIPRMRQRLDDALKVFEFGAFIELLSRPPNPSTGPAASRSEPDQTHGSSGHHRPCGQGRQTSQTVGQARGYRTRPPPLRLAGSHPAAATMAQNKRMEDGELVAEGENVKRLRHSIQHDHSTIKMMELATALGRLSNLLAKAGRTSDALEASQESAELYRTLAEKGV